jgi:hypothetical protein
MAVRTWLIDKSALNRITEANDEWLSRIQRGLVKDLDGHSSRGWILNP